MPPKKTIKKKKRSRTRPAQRVRRIIAMSRPVASSPEELQARAYIASLYADKLIGGCELPSFGHSVPYQKRFVYARGTFTAGAGLDASLMLNPYMLWTDFMYFQRVSNNGEITQFIPTAMANGTTTAAGSFPSDAAATAYSTVLMNQRVATTADVGHQAHVRPLGVRIRVLYVGTELNMGGEVLAIHNPHCLSLVSTDDANATAGAAWDPVIVNTGQASANLEATSIHRLGRCFEFVWRPSHLGFQQVRSLIGCPTVAVAAVNAQNPLITSEGYVVDNYNHGGAAPKGWTCGLQIVPAAGTVATTLPYVFEIEAEYDFSLSQMRTGTFGSNSIGNHTPKTNPHAEAMIHNALADVHSRRARREVPHSSASLALGQKAVGTAEAYAKKAFSGMAAQAGAEITSSLASLL